MPGFDFPTFNTKALRGTIGSRRIFSCSKWEPCSSFRNSQIWDAFRDIWTYIVVVVERTRQLFGCLTFVSYYLCVPLLLPFFLWHCFYLILWALHMLSLTWSCVWTISYCPTKMHSLDITSSWNASLNNASHIPKPKLSISAMQSWPSSMLVRLVLIMPHVDWVVQRQKWSLLYCSRF